MIKKLIIAKRNIFLYIKVYSSTFIGEVVTFLGLAANKNRDGCRGIVFEINNFYIKILLINGDQRWLSINDSVHGTEKQVQIKVGFYILGKTVTVILRKKYFSNNNTNNINNINNSIENVSYYYFFKGELFKLLVRLKNLK